LGLIIFLLGINNPIFRVAGGTGHLARFGANLWLKEVILKESFLSLIAFRSLPLMFGP
jgi:hypothetical protein